MSQLFSISSNHFLSIWSLRMYIFGAYIKSNSSYVASSIRLNIVSSSMYSSMSVNSLSVKYCLRSMSWSSLPVSSFKLLRYTCSSEPICCT